MGDFGYKVRVATEKAKDKAYKAKKCIVKHGGKAVGACKNGWAKLKKSIKGKNRRVEYLAAISYAYGSQKLLELHLTFSMLLQVLTWS
ncbi:hypothetical protein MTR_4g015980 [Medicago truncatula]|uniref:Uncharacterized protein n=1 Tax=Medicago truncatula TaxID=3880 RepID=A0A072UHL8_MEDTR|nr:hypothetical protein MTR_4g015980 [Medicago truncatula]